MVRKNYFTFFLAAALFLTSGISVFAQLTPIEGKVELKKADGTTVPVEGATVDLIRTDIKSTMISVKTDKDGVFAFEGLPPEAVFTLAVSAPNTKAEYYPNLTTELVGGFGIVVSPGDGKRLTEDTIRKAISSMPTEGVRLTAEQKKQQEEYKKQAAEINAKNAKSKETDALVKKALDEGSAAFKADNFDVAIVKFDEGYKASPDFIGSAPALLNNKALALRLRGATVYNQNAKSTDATAKVAAMNKVSKDFADAIDAYNASWTLSKNVPAAEIKDQKSYEANKLQALTGVKDVVRAMVVTEKIDSSKLDIIKSLMQEYVATAADKNAKVEAQVAIADLYRISGDTDNAITEYRKALEIAPDNPDALAGLGLSLFDAGERNENTQQKQEGLNYMQKFADTAPANHRLKESVAGAVEYLKSQNLAPQKTNTKKKN